MEKDEFLTISAPAEGSYKEKGSKFLGFARPAHSEDQVKEHLQELKSQYHDARHHCYAYRLGPDMELYRMNDDGEPSSTAGKPIYGQIISHNLTNVLVVVVRYFGGTLLGTSGLIRAYKTAAATTLDHARIITQRVHSLYLLEFNYDKINQVMRILDEHQIPPEKREFTEICRFTLALRQSRQEQLSELFQTIPEIRLKPLDQSIIRNV